VKALLTACAVGLCSVAGSAAAATAYAPYVDMTAWPTPVIDQIGVRQGIQQFNLAFVVAANRSCTPSWGGVQSIGPGISSDLLTAISGGISRYRAKGGEVAVSFGGANGTPLAQACSSVATLTSAYQTVIDTYSLAHIDFDIEGAAVADPASIERRSQAIAQLQKNAAAKGKALHVTLTLPVMPYGLTQDGLNVVNSAIRNKVVFDAVNVMAMDYGQNTADMGTAALQAATSLYSQLDSAYKAAGQIKTNAQLWQLVGVTPMIGANDTQKEVFTLANANVLANFAANNNLGLIGIWSAGRDQACPGGANTVSPTCSGVSQSSGAFSAAFAGLTARWNTGVTKDSSYGGGGSSSGGGTPAPNAPWSASQIYTAGNTVSYNGATYQAQWWTQGDVPGQAAVWKQLSGALQPWSASVAYGGGSCVSYQGAKYCAKWWTQGDVPSSGGVWVKS